MSNLRDLAKDATPGPWSRSGVRRKFEGADSHMVYATVDGKEIGIAAVWFDPRTGDGFTDAAYIAAANPTAILALYARIEELEGALEVTRKLVADAAASGFTEIGPLELLYAHQAELTRTLLKETDRDRG